MTDISVHDNNTKSEIIKLNSNKISNNIPENNTKKSYNIRELACNLRDAVVIVSGQTIITDASGNNQLITHAGNGFFIKAHYIICPANLLILSPTLFSNVGRIPIYPNIPTNGNYPNSMIRVSRVLVDISNVNGSGVSYSYEADIVGIDGAANIGILRINTVNLWNKQNPPIRICHPFLQWGKSRSSSPGDTVMIIGNSTSAPIIGLTNNSLSSLFAENAINIGIISDNRYVFPGGHVPGELLLLSNVLTYGSQNGLPIITNDGVVIGMSIHISSATSYNVALSEFFMRRPVKALIRSYQDKTILDKYKGFIDPVIDPINDYYRFNKSWLGLGGILMTQEDYNTNIVATTINDSTVTLQRIPIIDNNNLIVVHSPKEIVGYRILAVAGPYSGTGLFMPGSSSNLIPDIKQSPLYGIISYGDIITKINNWPLGDRKGQISPSLVMWKVKPGDFINIMYKKQSEQFEKIHEITICTGLYEPFLDFPYYSINESIPKTMLPTLI